MYQPLVPCPACSRHVRTTEGDCPFCAAPLPTKLAPKTVPAPPSPSRRLSRSASLALTASLSLVGTAGSLAATVAGCGSSDDPPTPSTDGGGDTRTDTTTGDTGGTDADSADSNSPDTADAAVDSGPSDTGGLGTKYGGPPFG